MRHFASVCGVEYVLQHNIFYRTYSVEYVRICSACAISLVSAGWTREVSRVTLCLGDACDFVWVGASPASAARTHSIIYENVCLSARLVFHAARTSRACIEYVR